MHLPQSVEAATELREIAAVPLQIVSPRESVPIVSVVQDTLVGANRFTRPNVFFTRKEAMNLLVHAKRWNGVLPPPVQAEPQPMWNGQQLLSALLPPVSLQMPNNSYSDADKQNPASQNMVKILNGQIQQGILDKKVFSKALLHIIYNDYGPEVTVDFLDSLQAMIANFLMNRGFSVGISDLIADESTNQEMNIAINKLVKQVEDQILQLHTGLFENSSGRSNQEEFESKLMGILNPAVGVAGSIGLRTLSETNRMTNMVKAGSKGSDVNVSQMIATLGQQAIEGKRVPNGFQHRSLPHFKRFDDSARARGFISSSYIKGLQPDEFFFHAMSGREGLIDTAVKTADTGYMQRQIRVALEDLITQHDGSVRDATGNVVQLSYGEDGANATKLESQSLPLASMSDEEIRAQFSDGGEEYVAAVMEDRRILVENVFLNKPQRNVTYPVHLERMIYAFKFSFGLTEETATVTASEVSEAQNAILTRTHAHNAVWSALVRFHLSPQKLRKAGYTKASLDALTEQIVLNHWRAWVEPGQPVGVIAAQSIGEPATQMSAHYDTKVVIHNKDLHYNGKIGKYIDDLIAKNADKVITIGEESVVLDLDNGDAIVGVSTDEKTSWLPIKQVSRHPANGGLVEVRTRTGRITTATLTHSFLKRTPMGIAPVLGSELKVGDRVPVAKRIAQVAHPVTSFTQGATKFELNREFGWLCGIYIADGCFKGNVVSISKVNPMVETKLKEFAEKFGVRFSVVHKRGAFGPGKDNDIHSKDLRDFLEAQFSHGSFEKRIADFVFHAPTEFIAGFIGGYFDGDGNVSVERQHIRLSSRNESLMRDINRLLGFFGMYGYLGKETSIRMPDAVQYTLNLAKAHIGDFQREIGFVLPEKAEALREIVSYKARADKPDRSQDMLDKIPACGELIAETGKLLELPGQSRTYGRWAKKESVGRDTLRSYLPRFKDAVETVKDAAVAAKVRGNIALLESAAYSDILWDEIVELKYHEDPHTFVYDFTVPGNDSFMVDDNIMVHNTLNSVAFDTVITVGKNKLLKNMKIGEFIDAQIAAADPAKIQHLPNNQIYVPLDDDEDWKAVSVDENGRMQWTRLEAVTKHPVINEDGTDMILEVTTESGRTVQATKALSFLTYRDGKIVDIKGSDLRVGDVLPVANATAIGELGYVKTLDFKQILSPTEYLYGDEAEKALAAMRTADAAGERHWFSHANGKEFTVPYSRSDSFRYAFAGSKNTRVTEFKAGFVYPKMAGTGVSHIPATPELTREFGYFCGAFLSEGSSSKTQIQITNNDDVFLAPIRTLMDTWSVGHHTVSEDRVAATQSLVIHSTILATAFRTLFGTHSHTKTIPDWVFQAPDAFVEALIDGYYSGDGCIHKDHHIAASTASEELAVRLGALLARFGIFTTHSSRIPPKGMFDSVVRQHTVYIPQKYAARFATRFTLTATHKQERLFEIQKTEHTRCKRQEFKDVVLDKIKSITEVSPKGGFVYDVTVEGTRNFTALNQLCIKDTFHLSGVASKSAMTRGVPRLKELLKATHNPKATELTIPLRRDLRGKKEEARRVAQELEFTLLQDIVTISRIYYDPDDNATLIAEDEDWLAYLAAFEATATPAGAAAQHADPLSAAAAAAAEDAPAAPVRSPWILRFELDREKMFVKNITMDDIAFILRTKYQNDLTTIYTDYNATRLVFRARINKTSNPIDDLNLLKALQNKVLSATAVRGIPGLRSVTYQKVSDQVELREGKYQPVDQYILISDGSNFLDVLTNPDIDPTRVVSSDIHDMFANLGIEATRATLYKEIDTLFKESGSTVNYRHVGLLLDKMCHKGRVMSVDRYGINKNDIGPLAKMSFEQTEDIALRAAMFGERDPVLGVSAKVMLGAPIKAGTSFSEILLDEAAAIKLGSSAPEQIVTMARGPSGYTEEEVEDALYGAEDGGECSRDALHLDVALPAAMAPVQETMEEDVEIAVI